MYKLLLILFLLPIFNVNSAKNTPVDIVDLNMQCIDLGKHYYRCENNEIICYERRGNYATLIECKWK
jgi:hypothetical protein